MSASRSARAKRRGGRGARAPLQRLVCVVAAGALACAGPAADVEEPGIASVVVTQWNDSTELFLEYPELVAGQQTGNWAIHLTDLTDFQPIRMGTLTVRFTPVSGGGVAETFTMEGPARDGIFLLDPAVARPGTYSVELELASPQVRSTHVLPEVVVHASMEEAPVESAEEESGGIAFLKEQQWVIPFAVLPAPVREVLGSVRVPAEVVPPDGALVQVSAPVDGIAPAEQNRAAPSVGARVQEGEVLAVLAPAAAEGGYAEVRGRVERLEVEVARAERLLAAGAIPQRRLDEARHDLEIARAELEAMGGSTGGEYLLRLRSPITGIVARRDFIPGGRVAAGGTLFTVVNPSTAWLRVQLPVSQSGALSSAPARFSVEGSDEILETARRLSVGTVVDSRTRTVPVVYEVTGRAASQVTFGQIAEAHVPLEGLERGVALPRSALLDDNGTTVAYVQVGGEEFERRVLTLGPTDGAHVLVREGVREGEMVVTTGAYQVRLASLSGNEFAGGHAH
jgi:membrane fusion protein, heavy metal efflux system